MLMRMAAPSVFGVNSWLYRPFSISLIMLLSKGVTSSEWASALEIDATWFSGVLALP